MPQGTLYIVATPIGNLGDITLRALETLKSVDAIVAEDTRHTRKLLTHYDIHKPLVSYHEHNARKREPELIARLQSGRSLALVTDAGTPGISDPGEHLVRKAVEAGLSVAVVPGPSAVTAALVISGLPPQPFAFLGFAPVKGRARSDFFAGAAGLPMTLVLYESPQRLFRSLEDMYRHWGNRRIAVARELTKRFEEVYRGDIRGALEHFQGEVRGEFTLVIDGYRGEAEGVLSLEPWREELRRLLASGVSVREAAALTAKAFRLPRNAVYRAALELAGGGKE